MDAIGIAFSWPGASGVGDRPRVARDRTAERRRHHPAFGEADGSSTLRPNEAGRAVKVMRSASLTMDHADALELALDIARVASGESELSTIVKTPSVARGVIELGTLLQRSET